MGQEETTEEAHKNDEQKPHVSGETTQHFYIGDWCPSGRTIWADLQDTDSECTFGEYKYMDHDFSDDPPFGTQRDQCDEAVGFQTNTDKDACNHIGFSEALSNDLRDDIGSSAQGRIDGQHDTRHKDKYCNRQDDSGGTDRQFGASEDVPNRQASNYSEQNDSGTSYGQPRHILGNERPADQGDKNFGKVESNLDHLRRLGFNRGWSS